MKDIFNKVCRVYPILFLSITLSFFGIFLVITSVVDISLFENNFSNQKITKLKSTFIFREDLSIKDLLNNTIQDENNNTKNLSEDLLISLNNFDLEALNLNDKTSVFDLHKSSNALQSFKDVKTKKETFVISILPLVIHANKKIRTDRNKLLEIKDFLNIYKTLYHEDHRFLESLADQYKIKTLNRHKIDIIEILLESVDEIPNSIVLAQAANESGWGTSRFATEFNALFGEYTFDINNGVVPIYRKDEDKYLIKFFPNINESIESYFKNLNTHPAYKNFRKTRKELRESNVELNPITLIKHLKPYAKDKNYIKTIESIVNTNKLIQFDNIEIFTTRS